MSIKELRESQAKLVADARAKLEEIKQDTQESRAKEIEAEYDRIMAEHDRIEERVKREQRLAEAEKVIEAPDARRPKLEDRTVEQPNGDGEITHKRAFDSYLRFGVEGMSQEERAVLRQFRSTLDQGEKRAQSTSNSAGGYTIPTDLASEIIVSMKAYGPMVDPGVTRQIVTASGNQINWPTIDDTSVTAYRLDENTQASNEGDLTFGQKVLNAYKYASGPILVSSELIQDSAFNVEQIVRDAMAIRFGRKLNTDMTTGDGSGDPNGIVTAVSVGTTAAANSAITFDELIDLFHSVDPAYRDAPSVRFMFNDSTLKSLRKLKDGQSRYIWQPADVRTGEPASILGKPYSVNQAMASIGTLAKTVLFGDFNKYIVRRVAEVSIRRLTERYADYDQVAFIGFARFDGDLMDTAAVKCLKHPT